MFSDLYSLFGIPSLSLYVLHPTLLFCVFFSWRQVIHCALRNSLSSSCSPFLVRSADSGIQNSADGSREMLASTPSSNSLSEPGEWLRGRLCSIQVFSVPVRIATHNPGGVAKMLPIFWYPWNTHYYEDLCSFCDCFRKPFSYKCYQTVWIMLSFL